MTESQSALTGGPKEGSKRRKALLVFISIVALVGVTDQVTKALVVATVPLNGSIEVAPGVLDIVHARNPGAAFGLLSGSASHWRRIFFIAISFAALAIILWLVVASPGVEWYLLGGYSLFFAGTLGNLVDRLRYGQVIDFIDVHWGRIHWPAFNVADSALCIGTALFLLHVLRQTRSGSDAGLRSGR